MDSLDERAKILNEALPDSMSMMAKLDEVSTTVGMEGIMRITPLWQA